MTVAIGSVEGRSIHIHADSALTGGLDEKFDPITGQLKAEVLDGRVSVAFSGHVGRALRTLRRAKAALVSFGFAEMLRQLVANSQPEGDADNAVDYLVASHLPDPELRIVREGNVSEPGPFFRIGDTAYADKVRREADAIPSDASLDGLPGRKLSSAFSLPFVERGLRAETNGSDRRHSNLPKR